MDNTRHQLKPSASGRHENQINLRDKIQITRDEIGRTVNTLQDRLSPDRMAQYIKSTAMNGIESVKTQAGATAELWSSSEAERILNKSIPAALIGVGLAWIMAQSIKASQKTNPRTGNYSSVDPHEEWPLYAPEEKSGQTWSKPANEQGSIKAQRAAIHGSLEQARKEGHQIANHAQERLLGEWTSEPHERERENPGKGDFRRFLQNNPLTMGAITLAIGTAVGLSLPRTKEEDLWMGKTRDHLIGRVKAASKDIVPKVRRTVRDMEPTTTKIKKDEVCGEKTKRT